MTKKARTGLWLLAMIVALILTVATVGLASRARTQAIVGETLYLDNWGGAIRLYQEPSMDAEIVAALVRGSQITVIGLSEQEEQTWYLVQKGEMTAGWIPANNVSHDPP